ncbi:hypothetical protein ACWDY4_26050 [Streptomyces olivaceoviridis]
MVERLEADGVLTDVRLREALLSVPREVLLPQAYVRVSDPGVEPIEWRLLDGAHPKDRTEWLDLVHSGESVLLQRDGERLDALVRGPVTGGHMTSIMGDGSLWTHRAPWSVALRELIQSYLGVERRAGTGAYAEPGRRYEDDLVESPFSDVEEHHFPLRRVWTPDQVVGYLRSTSFAGPDLFGDRHPRFATEARALLEQHAAAKGGLVEDGVFDVLLARRPGGAR